MPCEDCRQCIRRFPKNEIIEVHNVTIQYDSQSYRIPQTPENSKGNNHLLKKNGFVKQQVKEKGLLKMVVPDGKVYENYRWQMQGSKQIDHASAALKENGEPTKGP